MIQVRSIQVSYLIVQEAFADNIRVARLSRLHLQRPVHVD